MIIGDIFRYQRPYETYPPKIGDYPNYFFVTRTVDPHDPSKELPKPLLEKGISPIGIARSTHGDRVPAILLSSSPNKAGSEITPWHDVFDVNNGHVRYYGDNKVPGADPAQAPGNKALLLAYAKHSAYDRESRLQATPIIIFRRVAQGGRTKGFVEFQGFGIIEHVELITQYDPNSNKYFSNYVFDLLIMDMKKENELFSWDWISARRDPALSSDQTLAKAPNAWTLWVNKGSKVTEKCRRRIYRSPLVTAKEQLTMTEIEKAVLGRIYAFYEGRKSRFEALAAKVTESVLREQGLQYQFGWITPASGDGGADFIGRLDIGSGFGAARMIVLGQAKCEKVDTPTGGNHVARTVARLKRGWLGVYVTTSYFSVPVQREIQEDQYPVVLINGRKLAAEVHKMQIASASPDIESFLNEIDGQYEVSVKARRPEEII